MNRGHSENRGGFIRGPSYGFSGRFLWRWWSGGGSLMCSYGLCGRLARTLGGYW